MINIRVIIIDVENKKHVLGIYPAGEFLNSFSLEKNDCYDVGIDQSTSCTGIGIKSLDGKTVIVLEVVNNGLHSSRFTPALINFILRLLGGFEIRYLVIEQPLPYVSGQRNSVLTNLKNMLTSAILTDEKMNVKHFDSILPQSWRKGLIQKDNPFDKRSKRATVHEIIKKYPNMKAFKSITYNPTDSSGFDGFESLGIIEGYINRHAITNDNNITKIIGPKNTTKQAIGIFLYTDDLDRVMEIANNIASFEPKLGEPQIKYYNEEETIYANIRMALVDGITITTVSKAIDVTAIKMMFNIKEIDDDGKLMFMIVIPKNNLKKNTIQYLIDCNLNVDIFY